MIIHNKFLFRVIAPLVVVLSSCQGVHHMFRVHFWVSLLIIAIIVLLIIGLLIKLFEKKIV